MASRIQAACRRARRRAGLAVKIMTCRRGRAIALCGSGSEAAVIEEASTLKMSPRLVVKLGVMAGPCHRYVFLIVARQYKRA